MPDAAGPAGEEAFVFSNELRGPLHSGSWTSQEVEFLTAFGCEWPGASAEGWTGDPRGPGLCASVHVPVCTPGCTYAAHVHVRPVSPRGASPQLDADLHSLSGEL